MGIPSTFIKVVVIALILSFCVLCVSCSVGSVAKQAGGIGMTADEKKQALEIYAREGDPLARIALDESAVYVITASQGKNLTPRKAYYQFDPRTKKSVYTADSPQYGPGQIITIQPGKGFLVVTGYEPGFEGQWRANRTEISNAALGVLKHGSSSIPIGFATDETPNKVPSFAQAQSNRQFLSYFTDPTSIGGTQADYSYSPKKSITYNGRNAYVVQVRASNAYRRTHDPKNRYDYVWHSSITIYIDALTDLPVRASKYFDNGRYKYELRAVINAEAPLRMPMLPSAKDMNQAGKQAGGSVGRIVLVNELHGHGFVTLGESFKGLTAQPVAYGGSDSKGWGAVLIYLRGTRGAYIDEISRRYSASYKESFMKTMQSIYRESVFKDVQRHGIKDYTKVPVPPVIGQDVTVGGSTVALLYSYAGMYGLEMYIGDTLFLIRDNDPLSPGTKKLTKDDILGFASALVKNAKQDNPPK